MKFHIFFIIMIALFPINNCKNSEDNSNNNSDENVTMFNQNGSFIFNLMDNRIIKQEITCRISEYVSNEIITKGMYWVNIKPDDIVSAKDLYNECNNLLKLVSNNEYSGPAGEADESRIKNTCNIFRQIVDDLKNRSSDTLIAIDSSSIWAYTSPLVSGQITDYAFDLKMTGVMPADINADLYVTSTSTNVSFIFNIKNGNSYSEYSLANNGSFMRIKIISLPEIGNDSIINISSFCLFKNNDSLVSISGAGTINAYRKN